MRVVLNLQISLLDAWDRGIITAVQPHQQAGVLAQAQHLRSQRSLCNLKIVGRPVAPMFPVVAAAPAKQYKYALLVGLVKEFLGVELALKPDGVQSQIAHQLELIAQPLFIGAQQHVLRPSTAANQYTLAVDAKQAASVSGQLRGNLPDAEVHAPLVADHSLC